MAEETKVTPEESIETTQNLREVSRGKHCAIYDDERNERAIVMVEILRNGEPPRVMTTLVMRPRTKLGWKVIEYVIEGLRQFRTLIPFVLENDSMMRLMEYLYRVRSRSPGSVKIYSHAIRGFCEFAGKSPDELVGQCLDKGGVPDEKGIQEVSEKIDEYLGELDASDYAPSTVRTRQGLIVSFFKSNRIQLQALSRYRMRVSYRDRAPTQEELKRLIEVAGLREKAMIAMLATSGMRIGTLLRLKYRHVKEDLESGKMPIHIHVEAEITKGKYADYDTFINEEAAHYLKLYLEHRRRGTRKVPPEEINDESPLFMTNRYSNGKDDANDEAQGSNREKHLRIDTEQCSYDCARWALLNVFSKAGLVKMNGKRHEVRIHSIRKFFRTQLTALGMPTDYVEYMMGHKLSTYHDIQMKGIDFLRNVYAAANLRIYPKEKASLKDVLREIIISKGEDPAKYLRQEMMGGKDIVSQEDEVEIYAKAIWDMLRKELVPSNLSSPEQSNNRFY
jgi:integrase